MRLQVNLIPAIAYLLVTMLSNMTGLTKEGGKNATLPHYSSNLSLGDAFPGRNNCVYVSGEGQLYLSTSFSHHNLVWIIPGMETSQSQFARTEKSMPEKSDKPGLACNPS